MTSDKRINKKDFDALFNQMLKIVTPPKSTTIRCEPTPHHEQQNVEKLLVKLAKIKPISAKLAPVPYQNVV